MLDSTSWYCPSHVTHECNLGAEVSVIESTVHEVSGLHCVETVSDRGAEKGKYSGRRSVENARTLTISVFLEMTPSFLLNNFVLETSNVSTVLLLLLSTFRTSILLVAVEVDRSGGKRCTHMMMKAG